jgi:hypothetical protein
LSDEVDKANELAAVLLEASLKASRPRLAPTGECHFCKETLMDSLLKGSLFCNQDCRDDYERQERMRAINGR